MIEEPHAVRHESRWPVAIAIVAVLAVLTLLPSRTRLLPWWFPYALGTALLLPMAGVVISRAGAWWLRVEWAITLVFAVLAEAVTLTTLLFLVGEMLERPAAYSGRQLLTSSIAGWVTNILVFSLVYWRIDRGGPEARANDAPARQDWYFPQTASPEVAIPGWRPTFVDYLFVSFTAAAAFSPADALPLTPRAKLLMMAESLVSLATLVVVASRAVGLLGS